MYIYMYVYMYIHMCWKCIYMCICIYMYIYIYVYIYCMYTRKYVSVFVRSACARRYQYIYTCVRARMCVSLCDAYARVYRCANSKWDHICTCMGPYIYICMYIYTADLKFEMTSFHFVNSRARGLGTLLHQFQPLSQRLCDAVRVSMCVGVRWGVCLYMCVCVWCVCVVCV